MCRFRTQSISVFNFHFVFNFTFHFFWFKIYQSLLSALKIFSYSSRKYSIRDKISYKSFKKLISAFEKDLLNFIQLHFEISLSENQTNKGLKQKKKKLNETGYEIRISGHFFIFQKPLQVIFVFKKICENVVKLWMRFYERIQNCLDDRNELPKKKVVGFLCT